MLKRTNRLKSRGDFKRALAGKRLCANPCFALYGLLSRFPAGEVQPAAMAGVEPRVGFIVSKKVHKKSNRRNLIRRRLRELVRLALRSEQKQRLAKYRTLVFIARNGSLDTSFQDLKSHMERCFKNL